MERNSRFGKAIVGARAQDHMWGLRLYPRTQIGPRIKKVNDERPPDQTP